MLDGLCPRRTGCEAVVDGDGDDVDVIRAVNASEPGAIVRARDHDSVESSGQ